MKISKLLPITLALVLGMSCAYAAPASKAQADYELTLPQFFNVTHTPTNVTSNVTYNDTYTSADIANALTGSYTVITNESTDIYLYASCEASDDTSHALYGAPGALKIVFTNTTPESPDQKLTAAQVQAMMTTPGSTKDSPNAVAFNLEVTPNLVANTFPTGKSIATDAALKDNSLKYSLPNCNATFAYSVSGSSADSSFSTLDQKGTYEATLYLTNAQPAKEL